MNRFQLEKLYEVNGLKDMKSSSSITSMVKA